MGDPFGMPIAHTLAAGMGGIRTAGDLVAWMQLTRKMKVGEAKRYVADKLGVEPIQLTDEEVMRELRERLQIGPVTAVTAQPRGMLAKCRIAELLEIDIPSVKRFRDRLPSWAK